MVNSTLILSLVLFAGKQLLIAGLEVALAARFWRTRPRTARLLLAAAICLTGNLLLQLGSHLYLKQPWSTWRIMPGEPTLDRLSDPAFWMWLITGPWLQALVHLPATVLFYAAILLPAERRPLPSLTRN